MLDIPHPTAPHACDRANLVPRLRADTDFARAPVVFGWLLYRQDRFAGAVHLETLYRLDRVGGAAGEREASLQPSAYFGQSVEMLGALLRAQQHTRLPLPPPGCRWLGPQLVAEVGVPPHYAARSAPAPGPAVALPAASGARLAFARALARRLLHGAEGA